MAFTVDNQTDVPVDIKVNYAGWWFSHSYTVLSHQSDFVLEDGLDLTAFMDIDFHIKGALDGWTITVDSSWHAFCNDAFIIKAETRPGESHRTFIVHVGGFN